MFFFTLCFLNRLHQSFSSSSCICRERLAKGWCSTWLFCSNGRNVSRIMWNCVWFLCPFYWWFFLQIGHIILTFCHHCCSRLLCSTIYIESPCGMFAGCQSRNRSSGRCREHRGQRM